MPNKPNARFFRELLRDRGLSQRRLAGMMKLDPSALTLAFRGDRKFTPSEVVQLARYLEAPIDEVLRQLHLDVPLSVSGGDRRVQVVGEIDNRWGVTFKKPQGEALVAAPAVADSGMQALRFVGAGMFEGAYAYYRPTQEVLIEAVSRLSVCATRSQGVLLAVPVPGSSKGGYLLRDINGALLNADAWLDSASPVRWLRLSP